MSDDVARRLLEQAGLLEDHPEAPSKEEVLGYIQRAEHLAQDEEVRALFGTAIPSVVRIMLARFAEHGIHHQIASLRLDGKDEAADALLEAMTRAMAVSILTTIIANGASVALDDPPTEGGSPCPDTPAGD